MHMQLCGPPSPLSPGPTFPLLSAVPPLLFSWHPGLVAGSSEKGACYFLTKQVPSLRPLLYYALGSSIHTWEFTNQPVVTS